MAYYSGQAASYDQLLTVLVNACVLNGWTWADNILNKSDVYIKLVVSSIGITATGGTGKSGATLLNAALTSPRIGNPHTTNNKVSFPASYRIFVFEYEVYLIVKSDINKFFYLAFGKSNLNLSASGLWISATACGAGGYGYGIGIGMSATGGGAGGSGNPSAVAPFWNGNNFADNWSNAVIAHGFDGIVWSSGSKIANFVSSLAPLNDRQPSAWSTNAILLPINVYVNRASSKKSLACQFQHSRYLRIDNFDPEQIIQLGSEKWMIFPFFQKNITSRNGGDNTGTFGWAIRYDGS